MEQISMFSLLGVDDTPEIPLEQQKEGVKGWFIEINADFLPENGYKRHVVGVTTARVILEKDTRQDRYGWCQYAHVIEGGCKGDGWWAWARKLYVRKPTWRELEEYVKRNYKGDKPYEIVYVKKDGDAIHRICDFDTGEPIPNYFK